MDLRTKEELKVPSNMTPGFHFVPMVSAQSCHLLGSNQGLWKQEKQVWGEGGDLSRCLFNRYLLSTFYMPGTVQAIEKQTNQTKIPVLEELAF